MAEPLHLKTEKTITTDQYHKVTVTGIFDHAGEHFEPGTTYYVPAEVFNSKLGSGKAFSEMCATAEEVDHY